MNGEQFSTMDIGALAVLTLTTTLDSTKQVNRLGQNLVRYSMRISTNTRTTFTILYSFGSATAHVYLETMNQNLMGCLTVGLGVTCHKMATAILTQVLIVSWVSQVVRHVLLTEWALTHTPTEKTSTNSG